MASQPLLHYGLVAMQHALGFACGPRGVVHDREVKLGSVFNLKLFVASGLHHIVVIAVAFDLGQS